MLQFDEAGKQKSILDLGTDDLGIDSLNAVEIRTWFLKELKVDMPVLRILGGATVADLLDYALEKLPDDLVPGLGSHTNSDRHENPERVPQTSNVPEAEPSAAEIQSDSFSFITTPESLDAESPSLEVRGSSMTSAPESARISHSSRPTLQRREAMSFGQSRFWFLRTYLEDQTTFNITCSICLRGDLRIDDFGTAVRMVGQRHEALRTCFFVDDQQQPMQGVLAASTLSLERREFNNDHELEQEVTKLKEHVYDLEGGQTMRILLLSQSSPQSSSSYQSRHRHQILIGYHHINMDGISLQILLAELEKAYNHQPINSAVLQYPDFTSRQRQEYSKGKWNDDIVFWRKEFPDFPPTLPLLSLSEAKSRQALTRYEHHRVDFRIDSTLAANIRDMCRKSKITPYHFYLATFEALLLRFSDVSDLCIGVADGNRTESDMLDSIGFYLNLLPLRFKLNSDKTFAQAVKEARTKAYTAMAHSRLPFDVLLNEVEVPRSATHNPLFQVFLDYRQGVQENRSFGNCQLEGQYYETGSSSYDIALDIVDNLEGNSLLMLAVQKSLYTFDAANILMKSYLNLLNAFSKDSSLHLDQAPIFGTEDIQKAIDLGRGSLPFSTYFGCSRKTGGSPFIGPTSQAKWPPTLSDRVDAMVESFGDQLALRDGSGRSLTYRQMAERVDSIATALLDAKIANGARVGVFQEPSSDWICSLLAIMRIGAVYVPLDLRSTIPRLVLVVNDCKPGAILASAETMEHIPALKAMDTQIIDVSVLPASQSVPVSNRATPDSVAAILYTSGSTGIPKGIVLKHSSLRNNIEGNTEEFKLGPGDYVLQQIALSFDFSLWQIFIAIANGAAVYVVPKLVRGDAMALVNLISAEGITLTGATPSEYISWLRYGNAELLTSSNWKMVISAGEQMTGTLKQALRGLNKPNLRLFNGYGPTEATISSNKIEMSFADPLAYSGPSQKLIPAGFTAPNYSIYIADENLKPVPVGVPGQILIGGAGIATGYLNNEDLSKQKFMSDAFAPAEYRAQGWTTVHLTGDRGRLRADGALVVEGRITGDTQIKLRGLRIDLRDIETTIVQNANGTLFEVVVSLRRVSASSPEFLVAHALFSPTYPRIDRDRFLQELAFRLPLPLYMRPAMMIALDRMPVNIHGKMDRAAVNAFDLPQSSQQSLESLTIELTETETRLIEVWEKVISREIASFHTISKSADFFHVGGNSLLLVKLRVEIRKTFGVDLPLVQLFEASTVEDMASRIQSSTKAVKATSIDWDHETQLPPELSREYVRSGMKPHAVGNRVVVLTGATGFLGKALLQQLVEDDRVAKIHCIAVRSSPKRKPLIGTGKVIVHVGDLTLPRLGLSEDKATAIFEEADAVIHNGADVSFLKTFQTLKKANVDSTMELVKMSFRTRVPFHYISTTGVGHLSENETFEEASAGASRPPTNGAAGYIASKWASEQLLQQAGERFGIPICIHRPSSITGPDAPELDLMHNLLKYSRILRAVPQSSSWHGYLDFISVDRAAAAIVHQVMHGVPAASPGSVDYVHVSGELQVPLADMKTFMENESGHAFRGLSLGSWAAEAEDAGLDGLVAAYLKRVDVGAAKVVFPRIMKRGQRGS